MKGLPYPLSLDDMVAWAKENRVAIPEARTRFVHFVVLNCIASDAQTARCLALKGGNALRFAYQNRRSTKDLDFSVTGEGLPDSDAAIRVILDQSLRFAHRRYGVKARCQRVKRQPPNPEGTHPTYDVGVCYQFPGDRYYDNFDDASRPIPSVVPLEISINDLVCETNPWSEHAGLLVCSLEDILAEKLRALLQQSIGNRTRSQDVFDIAQYADRPGIDLAKIVEFLRRKCEIREIRPRKSLFNDEARSLAEREYDTRIRQDPGDQFLSFDVAWGKVVALVRMLDIPE